MISYIGIGFMKLYGISRPLQYRNITIRKTKQLIGLRSAPDQKSKMIFAIKNMENWLTLI